MTAENLEQKIRRIGNPVTMMRNSPQGHYEFLIPSEFSNWGDEQAAWQHTAVLFDESFHMTDVYFRGSNLKEFFATIALNSFATFGPDKGKPLVMVNPDGWVIGDGILFGLGMEEFSLVGRPAAPGYGAFMAEGDDFDIEVTRDLRGGEGNGRRLIFRYQLQGPNALAVLEKAGGGPSAIDRAASMRSQARYGRGHLAAVGGAGGRRRCRDGRSLLTWKQVGPSVCVTSRPTSGRLPAARPARRRTWEYRPPGAATWHS